MKQFAVNAQLGPVSSPQDIMAILTEDLTTLEPMSDEVVSPPGLQRLLDVTQINPDLFDKQEPLRPPTHAAIIDDKVFNDLKETYKPGIEGLARFGYNAPITDPYGGRLRSELRKILNRV